MKDHEMTIPLPKVYVLTTRDTMTTRTHTLLPATPIPEGIHELLTKQFSEMPIVNETGEYLGMFSETCCMRVLASLVELIDASKRKPPKASDVMVPRHSLLTLAPEGDVFDAMASLLKHGFSGAPVIDQNGHFLGVFSEKTCLGYVIEAAYSGLPSAKVRGFIDPDSNRLIDADTDLHTIAKVFMETSYGRLPVMHDRAIVGQISRRDVLTHSGILASIMRHRLNEPQVDIDSPDLETSAYLRAHDTLPDHTVLAFADVASHTIEPDMNLLSVAQLFFTSPCRRFAVLENQRLIGQLTRCDVLRAALNLFE
jgi:CBS domain-containing protein